MDATGAILLIGMVVVILLGGLGAYFVARTDTFAEWWEGFKEREAARRAAMQAQSAATLQARQSVVEVGLPPDTALEWSVEAITQAGWGLENRTHNSVTFARHEGADTCLGCALMLLLLVPGILYLLLAERTARITITAYPTDSGSRLVIGGDDPNAVQTTIDYANKLPKPGEWAPKAKDSDLERAASPHAEPAPQADIPEQIRRLAELRDEGMITAEEFEAKKKELLDRL